MSFGMNGDFPEQVAALQAKFRAKAEKLDSGIKKALNTCAVKVERDIKENMTPNGPSAPGEAPAVDTGRLRASISHRVETDSGESAAYVGTNVEYAPWLEFGTSRMRARPFMVPAMNRNREWIKATLKSVVKNPGSLGSET
jgi:HK97 gp10 family phage protein